MALKWLKKVMGTLQVAITAPAIRLRQGWLARGWGRPTFVKKETKGCDSQPPDGP